MPDVSLVSPLPGDASVPNMPNLSDGATTMTTTTIFTGIVDIHHDDGAYDLDDVVAGGVAAMWVKNSEGVTFMDPSFVQAMDRARAAGLMRGAYHFARGTSGAEAQADAFADDVRALYDYLGGEDVLTCLDLEGDPRNQRTMSTDDAARFLVRAHELLGRWPVLYMGLSKGRSRVRKASAEVRAILARCPLWLAAYGPDPLSLDGLGLWPSWSLQQYTNGSAGPRDRVRYPRETKGFFRARQDRSASRGSVEELRVWWQTAGRS